jgi:hypothetical protein
VSRTWVDWAWRTPTKGNEKLVLLALADRARREDGVCWPGLRTVADDVGLGESTVRRVIGRLEEKALLHREARTRADGSQTSSLIVLGGGATAEHPPLSNREGAPLESSARSEPGKGTEEKDLSNERSTKPEPEPVVFSEWVGYHAERSGRSVPRAGTKARAELARRFAKLQGEGAELEDFKLATDGVLGNDWMVSQGHTKFSTVLWAEKFWDKVDDGRGARSKLDAGSKYAAFDGEE